MQLNLLLYYTLFINNTLLDTLSNLPRGCDWLPWLQDLFIPVPNQLPGEDTVLPPFWKALVTIQTHKQSLSNQVPIHSWVERVHMQVKCLAYGHHTMHTVAAKTHTKGLSIESHRPQSPHHNACTYMEYIIYLDVGTLRVVSARELVILSGSFTSHSKSVWWPRHLCGHVSHARCTVSNAEGQEINLHKVYPSRNRTPDCRLGRQI